jgi:hypothetical protein
MHAVFRNNFSKRAFQASKMTRTSRLFTNQASVRPAAQVSKLIFGAVVGLVAFGAMNQNFVAGCSAKKVEDEKPAPDAFANTALFPPIKPFDKGFLKVGDVHTIAYSQYGNPTGKPVLFIHGGPGGGTTPMMARFFDPKIYRVILVDQRGCGESTPFANLQDNTTSDSIRDFEKLREKLKISKWQLFGGSWGSTLGLAYAVRNLKTADELNQLVYNMCLSLYSLLFILYRLNILTV